MQPCAGDFYHNWLRSTALPFNCRNVINDKPTGENSMKKKTIVVLLIDGDTEYHKVVEYHMRRYAKRSFQLIWKRNENEGLRELQSNRTIDIVLMDYILPSMDGISVMRLFRENKINVPVVFLTTHRNFETAVEALRLGVCDYIIKDSEVHTKLPDVILSVLGRIDESRQAAELTYNSLLQQKRSEAIRELIVTINHEINNPLAAIKICADILTRQHLSENERLLLSELLQKIEILEQEIGGLKNLTTNGEGRK